MIFLYMQVPLIAFMIVFTEHAIAKGRQIHYED